MIKVGVDQGSVFSPLLFIMVLETLSPGFIQWMCNVILVDKKSSDELRDRLVLVSIGNCIQSGRVRLLVGIKESF